MFEGLFTGINEYGEIRYSPLSPSLRLQCLTQSSSHEQTKEAFLQLIATQEKRNAPSLKIVYTDKCCQDRNFLEETIPSLRQDITNMPILPLNGFVTRYVKCERGFNQGLAEVFNFLEQAESRVPIGLDIEYPIHGAVALLQLALPYG